MAKDKELIRLEQERIYLMVQRFMKTMYHKSIGLPEVKKAIVSGKDFSFFSNPAADKAVNKLIQGLNTDVKTAIISGIVTVWKEGEASVWKNSASALVSSEAQNRVFNQIRQIATSEHRGVTAQTFINEKKNGFNLSSRVWRTTSGAKTEIEIIIQNGMKEGKSADEITRGLQQYLKDPDKLFRRVRNKATGELELSRAAQNYKPGQGVYRSSYKNALRLAITEINRAYREAQWFSLQDNPLVTGYEIVLSNNHTCSDGKGGLIPNWTDICDELAGRYPKWFKWTGWHPHCRCRMIPILIGKEDFAARVAARANDKLEDWKPSEEIKDLPDSFTNWIDNNSERIDKAANKPFWIQDNFKKGIITAGLTLSTPTINAVKNLATADLYSIIKGKEDIIRMNKTFETGVLFNPEGKILLEKRGVEHTASVEFTKQEVNIFKDNIFTHNHPIGWGFPENSMLSIGNSFSPEDVVLAVNNDLLEIRAVSRKIRFSMKRPSKGWPDIGIVIDEINFHNRKTVQEFVSRIDQGIMTEQQAQAVHFHTLWKSFSESLGIKYSKEGL